MKSALSKYQLPITFAAAVLMLLVASGLSYQSIRASADGARWVQHTYQVLQELDQLSADLTRMGSSTRDYLRTGSNAARRTFEEAATSALRNQSTMRRLTKDNPRQQSRIPELETLVADYITADRATMEQRQNSPSG